MTDDLAPALDESDWQAGMLIRRPGALSVGYDDYEIGRLLRTRSWQRLRRGAYLTGPPGSAPDLAADHRILVRATLPLIAESSVISHQSAAIMHGLAVWGASLSTVHVTRRGHGGGHRRRWVHTHVAPLRDDEVVVIDGVPTTSVARTLVDIARTAGFEPGVVTADHALHAGLLTGEQLAVAAAEAKGRTGVGTARQVARFADGRAESPGESRSRVQIMCAGLPRPELQAEIWSADGEFLGRVDFLFEKLRTVGEFDGQVKYGRMLAADALARNAAAAIGRVVFEEKRREDAIRALPLSVARWIWRDIDRRTVARTVSRGFAVGRNLLATPLAGSIGRARR
jgi:hypothetical protein